MFGYVRPLKGEMKVREYDQFKAVYCGLCHQLRKSYGFTASWTLSYELTFLALLLEREEPRYCHRRCVASPFRKKCTCASGAALEYAADVSVLLTWYKFRDSVEDDRGLRALGARVLSLFWRRKQKKAARKLPAVDAAIRTRLQQLRELELARIDSLDRPADCFARLLADLAEARPQQRVLEQLLYHLGRWIYLIDALDDLHGDLKRGDYNPIAVRFALTGPGLDAAGREQLNTTLSHSEGLMRAAFALLPPSPYTAQLDNILSLGLPFVREQVAAGTWRSKREKHPT